MISSPLAPKHGCEPLSAAESASNGGSRCIGNAAGGGDAAADAAAGAGLDTDDELGDVLGDSEAGSPEAGATYHRLDKAGRGDERVIATACFGSRLDGAAGHEWYCRHARMIVTSIKAHMGGRVRPSPLMLPHKWRLKRYRQVLDEWNDEIVDRKKSVPILLRASEQRTWEQ